MPQKRIKCFRLLFDHLAWMEHEFLSGIRDSRKPGRLWEMMISVGGVRKSTGNSDSTGSLNSTVFCSIRRPYITFKLPHRDIDMPPQFLPISGNRDVSLPLSLEWPVWSSSSGNNCHAVHRSLSSGASLWSGTFTLSHIISWAHLRDFFRLLAIGMCHFLPVHHLGIVFLGRVESQNITHTIKTSRLDLVLIHW